MIAAPEIEALDLAPVLADPRNVLLVAEGGGLIFNWHESGVYEVHNNWLPAYRGRYAMQATRDALRWMFTRTDCMIVLTRIPAFNKAAARLCALVGGIKEFERKAVWRCQEGLADLSFWRLSYEDWLRRTPEIAESGRAFHAKLDEEFARHRMLRPTPHADELCHDLYVGAWAETTVGGQPEKAVILYNRWARFAGFNLFSLLSREPLVVDMGDAVLQMNGDGSFKAVYCRGAGG